MINNINKYTQRDEETRKTKGCSHKAAGSPSLRLLKENKKVKQKTHTHTHTHHTSAAHKSSKYRYFAEETNTLICGAIPDANPFQY